MKIKQEQVERCCRLILEHLKEKKLIILKAPENKVYQKLVDTFLKNVKEEEQLEEQARALLEKTLESSSEDLDRQKMFLLIKRKLAKDRGFIL